MAVQSIDPSTATIVGGVGMILLLLLAWFVRYITEPVVYIEPVESLVTAAEQRFYEALDEAVDGRLMILSMMPNLNSFRPSSPLRPTIGQNLVFLRGFSENSFASLINRARMRREISLLCPIFCYWIFLCISH
jgi:hypothetical protein